MMTATNVGEAADMAEDFAEPLRMFPCCRKCTDTAAGNTANRAVIRVRGDVQLLLGHNVWQKFFSKEACILIAECVVFKTAIIGPPAIFRDDVTLVARIDEHADRYRHFAAMNQIVEYNWRAELAFLIHVCVAILKDHQARRLYAVVLGRDVDEIFAFCAFEDRAGPVMFGDDTFWNIVVAL